MSNTASRRQTRIPCMMMRGGTSKGAFFLASDLPTDAAARDRVLLAAMGSPDKRQIDGLGGADPLTSKVAIVSRSARDDAQVDYLFAQVVVDEARVDYGQNCGNMLAGVGPFAIERGLVDAREGETPVAIHMVNTGQLMKAMRESTACPARLPRFGWNSRTRPGPHAARCCRPTICATRSTASK